VGKTPASTGLFSSEEVSPFLAKTFSPAPIKRFSSRLPFPAFHTAPPRRKNHSPPVPKNPSPFLRGSFFSLLRPFCCGFCVSFFCLAVCFAQFSRLGGSESGRGSFFFFFNRVSSVFGGRPSQNSLFSERVDLWGNHGSSHCTERKPREFFFSFTGGPVVCRQTRVCIVSGGFLPFGGEKKFLFPLLGHFASHPFFDPLCFFFPVGRVPLFPKARVAVLTPVLPPRKGENFPHPQHEAQCGLCFPLQPLFVWSFFFFKESDRFF